MVHHVQEWVSFLNVFNRADFCKTDTDVIKEKTKCSVNIIMYMYIFIVKSRLTCFKLEIERIL